MNNHKHSSITLVMIFVMSTLLIGYTPPVAQGASVVITDAVQLVDGGSVNERMASMTSDSEGNIHVVWTRNTQHLYYTMLNPRAQTVIDVTQISNGGGHRAWHPDIAIDSEDRIHVIWTNKASQHEILYTLLDPSLDDQDGTSADDGVISIIEDTEVVRRQQNRDWPAIAVDSQDNAHLVWEDSFDRHDKYFQQPQIYYKFLEIDEASRTAITAIDSTLLTPIIGHKGHPDIAIDADDLVQIAWDDTRGGKVEIVAPIDTSGSMYSEWADMCVVFYGGTWSNGGSFQGIKPMLMEANISVFETLYALGGFYPSAATSGACAGQPHHENPRANHLDIGDDSGGLIKLHSTIYNGGAQSGGYQGEDWGPGSTWACLSWVDAQGQVPGNPPTTHDHHWNPNATKIVIPISDEGPKGGDPPQQSDDIASINEAHDACVDAGVIPVGLYGSSWGANNQVASHMHDLSECPNGQVNTNPRICPGSTTRNTDAGGQVYAFPASGSNNMATLVEAMVFLATNNSREIYMTVLDPYAKIQNPAPGWVYGDSGTDESNNRYTEDLGPSQDSNGYGHLVVVNDTRITLDDAFSLHPSLAIDNSGDTHLTWMDTRDYGFDKDDNYEVYYTRLRLRGAAEWDGVSGGLPTYGIKKIVDTRISYVEGANNVNPNDYYRASSYMPQVIADNQNNIHMSWLENSNTSQGESIMYTRLNHTNDVGDWPLNSIAAAVLDPWERVDVSEWHSDKLGPNSGRQPELSQPPAFANDLGSGAHIAWSDTNKCNENSNNGAYTLCYTHVLTGQVDVELADDETYYHVIEPGEQTIYNLTVNNSTPGPIDLVSDTFSVNLSGVPVNWTANLFFADNHTAIFPETPIFLLGGESVRVYLRVRAPSIYQANADELAQVVVSAVSHKDPAIRSDRLTLTLMDVVHGIELETSHYQSDVEQGETAIFSITITNTGNVFDTFAFYDPTTLQGQQEWLLPWGWQINFPLMVSLDPGQSVTKNLEISVPTTQDPGTFALYLKGWSMGEPVKSLDKGTYDVLELWVNVSIRSTGNIIFEIFDTSEYVMPGDCHTYTIDVIKKFAPGYLIFTTPGSPEAKPDGMPMNEWQYDHWTVNLDFSNAPGGNEGEMSKPRHWSQINVPYEVAVVVCAPLNASAGLGPAITVKAHLQGASRVSDAVILSTNVEHVYDLEMDVPSTTHSVDPGQALVIPITTTNDGNGPDRYDMRTASISDTNGTQLLWDIQIPRATLSELERDDAETIDVIINIPGQIVAGNYQVVLKAFSEESFEGTDERDAILFEITVNQFHDMQIWLDNTVESQIKTTAPGRTVRYLLNVTNNGNVPDIPTLHNHTKSGNDWNDQPSMGSLSSWNVEYAMVEDFDTELPREIPCAELAVGESAPVYGCAYHADGTWSLAEMPAYTTVQVMVIIDISPSATLANREIGIKVLSNYGGSPNGDTDETASWMDSCTIDADNDGVVDNVYPCDTNEQVLRIRLRAPDLEIIDVTPVRTEAPVGEMIPVNIQIINRGNVHATDINIVLCEDETEDNIRNNICSEENVAYRQVIGALMPPDDSGSAEAVEITLLYPVTAGNHDVVAIVDPGNLIIEANEANNRKDLGQLSSENGWVDVAMEAAGTWSVPTMILLLTIALMAVAGMVMIGRRREALARVDAQSSMVSIEDEMRF
ncbi:MAG: CARDB domain-containing protein [Candidatus Thalassarchaeaceae archaeon]|nr:CARDB domain-containing protein [Candidatus Thalassarchaeaceae archaeon]